MNTSHIRHGSLAAGLLAGTLLTGCAGTPARNAQLDQARSDYAAANNDPQVTRAAPEQLRLASANLSEATALQQQKAPQADVDHYARLATTQVVTARQLTEADASQAYVKQAGSQRSQMMLQASQQQTQRAQNQAATANARVDNADAQAASAGAQADQAQQQNAALLTALNAKQTDRGMVLTLGSVLFDSNDASLNASGERSLDKLGQFLRDNPKRNVRVEGYTDSTGSAAYNRDLSQRRADAVRSALVDGGLDAQRATTKGLGQDFAVASNQTASGRQQNRRVEVVISDADGTFPATR